VTGHTLYDLLRQEPLPTQQEWEERLTHEELLAGRPLSARYVARSICQALGESNPVAQGSRTTNLEGEQTHRHTFSQAQPNIANAERLKTTILVLTSDPIDAPRLRLSEEVKKIQQGLERSKRRDHFVLVSRHAVTDDELRRALLDYEPQIVHFSGHGSGIDGLCFEDDQGRMHDIPGDALARLFELCADHVECVVLNACYSEVQADAISQHIPFVVGMSKAVGDAAAIKFAVGFYDALGAGKGYKAAFKFGRSAIDLKNLPEHLTPVLKEQ
jgi:hypothetical protein